jgi:hypothetical protein
MHNLMATVHHSLAQEGSTRLTYGVHVCCLQTAQLGTDQIQVSNNVSWVVHDLIVGIHR